MNKNVTKFRLVSLKSVYSKLKVMNLIQEIMINNSIKLAFYKLKSHE